MSEYPISKNVDRTEINKIRLTLATWDSGYGTSFEIGFRYADGGFRLIQWWGISSAVAWDVTKCLTAKGASPDRIMRVLDRLGNK